MSSGTWKAIFGGYNAQSTPTMKGVPQTPPILKSEEDKKQFNPELPENLLKKQLEAARLGTAQFVLPKLNAPTPLPDLSQQNP